MCRISLDGPSEITIEGDRFIARNTSDGEGYCGSMRPEDAIITAERWANAVKEWRRRQEAAVIPFPTRAHADTG